jgi:toxin ParE1/3/4
MPEYRLSLAAERDLASIWRYTRAQWGREQANRYTLGLKAMCARLAQAPLQAESCANIRPGYRRRNAEHHTIYFRQTRDGIAVIRILHERMDAGMHL